MNNNKSAERNIYELTLSQGKITIGRADDNAVVLNDSSISAHHAQITTLFNASYIEDLGSKNGTFVNGKRIMKHTLHEGDVITIGLQRIKIVKNNQISVA